MIDPRLNGRDLDPRAQEAAKARLALRKTLRRVTIKLKKPDGWRPVRWAEGGGMTERDHDEMMEELDAGLGEAVKTGRVQEPVAQPPEPPQPGWPTDWARFWFRWRGVHSMLRCPGEPCPGGCGAGAKHDLAEMVRRETGRAVMVYPADSPLLKAIEHGEFEADEDCPVSIRPGQHDLMNEPLRPVKCSRCGCGDCPPDRCSRIDAAGMRGSQKW